MLLKGIHNASTTISLQKAVDNYISYRNKCYKEKVGSGGVITTLFNDFDPLSLF